MSLRTRSILNTAETRLTTLQSEQDDTRVRNTGSGDDPEHRDNTSGCEDSNIMETNTVGYILFDIPVVICVGVMVTILLSIAGDFCRFLQEFVLTRR